MEWGQNCQQKTGVINNFIIEVFIEMFHLNFFLV